MKLLSSARSCSVVLALLLVGLLGVRPPMAAAQLGREALRQGHEAYDFAEFDRAVELLSLGLDPSAGPQDSLWVAGLHKLADALLELGAEAAATAWIRWGFRLQPDLAIDSINFPPRVVGAIRGALQFVNANPAPRNIRLSWRWPAAMPRSANGALVIESGEVSPSGRIEGGNFLAAGVPYTLPAGSYTLLATAEGYLPVRGTVEILPGVTTSVRFDFEPAVAGYLYVASRPWGVVLVNGQQIGYTAIAGYRLAAGTYRVRVERPGYLPFDTTITVSERDQRIRLGNIQLRPERP